MRGEGETIKWREERKASEGEGERITSKGETERQVRGRE